MNSLVLTGLIAAVASLPIALSWKSWQSERGNVEAARASLLQTRRLLSERRALAAEQPTVDRGQRATQEVLAHVNAVLAQAGVPSSTFQSLDEESDGSLPGAPSQSALRRQVLRISLSNLRLDDIGQFLACWSRSPKAWTPTRLELSHSGRGGSAEGAYDLRMAVSITYLPAGGA